MQNTDKIGNFIKGLDFLNTHNRSRPYSYLVIPLDYTIRPLFEILFLNNYELSTWESFFLSLWSQNGEGLCITYPGLLEALELEDIPILHSYFLENEFVCTFTFFSINQLIPVLLSINKIQSNKFLTEIQARNFFNSLNLPNPSMELIEMWINSVERLPKNYISLQSLYNLVKTNEGLLFPIYNIKTHIIDLIITRKYYNVINKRIEYYKSRKGNYSIPKESMCEKITRKLNSNDPPPYYYNYSPSLQDFNVDNYLIQIRRKHGYSYRPDSLISQGRRSLHSEVKTKSLYSITQSVKGKLKVIGSPVIGTHSINLAYIQKTSTADSDSIKHSRSSRYVLHNGKIHPIAKRKSVL